MHLSLAISLSLSHCSKLATQCEPAEVLMRLLRLLTATVQEVQPTTQPISSATMPLAHMVVHPMLPWTQQLVPFWPRHARKSTQACASATSGLRRTCLAKQAELWRCGACAAARHTGTCYYRVTPCCGDVGGATAFLKNSVSCVCGTFSAHFLCVSPSCLFSNKYPFFIQPPILPICNILSLAMLCSA